MKINVLIAICIFFEFYLSTCKTKETTKQKAPEPNRFSKQIISKNLYEPIALVISNKGDVFYCERHGKVFVYAPKTGITTEIANLLVDDSGGNGVMGMCLDPDFDYNNRIFMFYIDTNTVYKLSRFLFINNKLEMSSEKLILSMQLDKEPGAHNGGTIAFDSKRNLVISTGDNTQPWQANGYPPYDQRVGFEKEDAQRSAANTNDLRGKILKIKPLENGSYIIPDGNLFPKDGSKGKPEIFAMGCRNPWKMSIDPKTDYIYWGEVGPDAGEDSTIGPRGYDEINQAKKPGNFGWPYFIANSKPYRLVDLVNPTPGAFFDAKMPANESKNNTGQKYLPTPTDAMIYYPYSPSKEFPIVGNGGRTACAGPFYDFTKYKSSVKFPAYYHNKFLIYDWMRDWIMAVTLDDKSNFLKMEKVMQNLTFAHPTHMAFAPDGSLYILEYGFLWYTQSLEAKLSRVIFSDGNRPPVPVISASDTIFGKNIVATFNANLSTDLDGDSLGFQWYLNETKLLSTANTVNFSSSLSGIYTLKLYAKDSKGMTANVSQKIIIGNTFPIIKFSSKSGNQSFYFQNQPLAYNINVTDKEDNTIDKNKIITTLNYIPDGKDIFPIMKPNNNETSNERDISENQLIASSDCKSCHAMYKKSVGPSFMEISKKYSLLPNVVNTLALKIIKGSSGVWGGHAMSAHPQLSQTDAAAMVEYILSLNNSSVGRYTKCIAPEGTISGTEFDKSKGWFYIKTSYTDSGADGIASLNANNVLVLKNSKFRSLEADSLFMCQVIKEKKVSYLGAFNNTSYAKFQNIDITNLSKVSININSKDAIGMIQLRVGAKNGKVIASLPVKPAGAWGIWSVSTAQIIPTSGIYDLYITFEETIKNNNYPNMINIDWVKFDKTTSISQ